MSPCSAFPPLVLLLAAGFTMGVPAAASATVYGTETVTIPFGSADTANGAFVNQPHVALTFLGGGTGSGSANFVVDTGSTGVVVGSDTWAPPPGTPNYGTGTMTYDSDGKVFTGTWYDAQLLISSPQAPGQSPTAEASLKVLVVQAIGCNTLTPGAACGLAMMGVGFAREKAGDTNGPNGTQLMAPPNNALLNITKLNGVGVTLSTPDQPGHAGTTGNTTAGYMISPGGLTIGLTATNTQGFGTAPLTWNNQTAAGASGWADWNPAPLSLTVNGVTGPGTVLNDTGISYAFVRAPDGAPTSGGSCGPSTTYTNCYASGTSIAVAIQTAQMATAAAAFSYVVGDINAVPAAPPFTRQDSVSTQPFMNTGLTFFDQFTYFYDYANGQVGYLDRSAAVPAPGALGLLGLAIGCLFATRRFSS